MASTSTNYPTSNQPPNNPNITLSFYNGFFNQNFSFDANEFGMIYGLFKSLKLDDVSTYTLTFSVLSEAKLAGFNSYELAKSLLTKDGLQLNYNTAQLLNRSRTKNSYIGFRVTSNTNPLVERMLVE
jgi:hypothetical protein